MNNSILRGANIQAGVRMFRAKVAPITVWSVLLAMLSTWIVIIRRYGANWPFWDELGYLSQVVGEKRLSLESLWAPHNDHEIFIPKLVYIGLMRLSDSRPVVLMCLSAVLVSCGIGCVVLAVRRARGRAYMLDAVLILAALSWSQYNNFLWAFQIYLAISAALVLLAIALAISVRHTTDTRKVVLIGAITMLLPLCGGLGMGMAPGLFVWLIGIGVIYYRLGANPQDRTFGVWSSAAGVIACGTWSLTVRSLPPSNVWQTAQQIVGSWAGFRTFLTHLHSTAVELFSTPFLPESIDRGLPFPYDGRVWGNFGLLLLVSGAAILLVTWIRRPQERLRIAALAGCLMGVVSLILALYLARGVYGPGAGAIARYSTVAMPALTLAIATYCLYAPKLLRRTVLMVIAAVHLAMLYGPHGNVANIRALGRMEHDAAIEFAHELSRPGGTTIEELTGHFATALYEPGEARHVPDFIQLMATYRIGPFRYVPSTPRHIVSWNASPFPMHADAVYKVKWNGQVAVKAFDVFGVISEELPKPTPISALRFTFRCKSPSGEPVSVFISWSPPGTDRRIRWLCPTSTTTVQTAIAYVFRTVTRIEVGLSGGLTEWELLNREQLEPTVTSGNAQ